MGKKNQIILHESGTTRTALVKEKKKLLLIRYDVRSSVSRLVLLDNLDHTQVLALSLELAKAAEVLGATDKDLDRAFVRTGVK